MPLNTLRAVRASLVLAMLIAPLTAMSSVRSCGGGCPVKAPTEPIPARLLAPRTATSSIRSCLSCAVQKPIPARLLAPLTSTSSVRSCHGCAVQKPIPVPVASAQPTVTPIVAPR